MRKIHGNSGIHSNPSEPNNPLPQTTSQKMNEFFTKPLANQGQDHRQSQPSSEEDSELDLSITHTEMMIAIKKLSSRKAPGLDGFPNEVLKVISIRHSHDLLQLLNNILERTEIPIEWCQSLIIPIYKKGDIEDPGNYRPFSLLPTCFFPM
jgi:hypothetical protein